VYSSCITILSSCPTFFHGRSGIKEDHTASWFSHANTEANQSREQLAHDSLEMLIQWLKDGGNVGIHGLFSFGLQLLFFTDRGLVCKMRRIVHVHGGESMLLKCLALLTLFEYF